MKVNEQTIQAIIKTNFETEARNHGIHQAIIRAFRKFEGKRVNKRIIEYVRAELGIGDNGVVYYHPAATFSGKVEIWGVFGIDHNQRFSFYFGGGVHSKYQVYSEAEAEKENACHGSAAIERNRERTIDLSAHGKVQRLVKSIEAFKAAHAELTDQLSAFEDRHSITKATGLDAIDKF